MVLFGQGGTPAARLYLSSQIKEAVRVGSLAGAEFDSPVFPLVKNVYASTKAFLSQVRNNTKTHLVDLVKRYLSTSNLFCL